LSSSTVDANPLFCHPAIQNGCRISFDRELLDAVIRVYDEAGNVIETHEQAGE
jgi:hypothetical protein